MNAKDKKVKKLQRKIQNQLNDIENPGQFDKRDSVELTYDDGETLFIVLKEYAATRFEWVSVEENSFILAALNSYLHDAHKSLEKEDIGDWEKVQLTEIKKEAKRLIDKLDNLPKQKCNHILNEPEAAQGIYSCGKCGDDLSQPK